MPTRTVLLFRRLWLPSIAACCLLASADAAEPLIVTADLQLDPAMTYGPLVITASNITIDGRGAILKGPGGADPSKYEGIAISAEGVDGVTLKNVKAEGWETGLKVSNAAGWTIQDCDFSDNFHDPKFGWGENGRRGGIVLENFRNGIVRNCKANRVWDACVLVDSNDNRIEGNDFSHASNTCLKTWNSSRNRIERNNLSYGIRIDPGEVHARDSTSVLMESGSNENRLIDNDCRYGGDGIFVRVLNGWVSTDNHFEGNDCSYANNNCIEAWSPRNTWIRNKANHGSYGFWLGASDKNVLIDNEASFNGLPDGNHNSPHLPDKGHAGIVFMFGPSSHTLLRGNRCEGNNGAGIAAIGDLESKGKKWNAFHWIVEQNTLTKNRWGMYLQNAEMFDLADNQFVDNSLGDVFDAGNVIGLVRHAPQPGIEQPPVATINGPETVRVGTPVTFDASGSSDPAGKPLTYRWRMQPFAEGDQAAWTRTFEQPGFYRVGLTVNNGLFSSLAYRDVYAVRDVAEVGTEAAAKEWTWADPHSKVAFFDDLDTKIVGGSSIRAEVQPYSGGRVTLRFQPSQLVPRQADQRHLVFWLKTRNANTPGWQDVNPVVGFTSTAGEQTTLKPKTDILSDRPYLEAREGWTYFSVPLAGDDVWVREGEEIHDPQSISLGFDSWGADPLVIWIDGLAWE